MIRWLYILIYKKMNAQTKTQTSHNLSSIPIYMRKYSKSISPQMITHVLSLSIFWMQWSVAIQHESAHKQTKHITFFVSFQMTHMALLKFLFKSVLFDQQIKAEINLSS